MDATHAQEDLAPLVRAGDYDRSLCIELAPLAARPHLYALTALHLELARLIDTVREPLLGHIRLAWWREALDEIEAGISPRQHPVILAMAAALAAHPALAPLLQRMIAARAADFDPELMPDEAAFFRYLDETTGILHAAWALVLDPAAARAEAAAIAAQARSYGLVSAMLAIPRMGARRLPAAMLAANGFNPPFPGPAMPPLVAPWLAAARTGMRPPLSAKDFKPLRGLKRLATLHAHTLERAGFDPFATHPRKLAAVWCILTMNIMKNS